MGGGDSKPEGTANQGTESITNVSLSGSTILAIAIFVTIAVLSAILSRKCCTRRQHLYTKSPPMLGFHPQAIPQIQQFQHYPLVLPRIQYNQESRFQEVPMSWEMDQRQPQPWIPRRTILLPANQSRSIPEWKNSNLAPLANATQEIDRIHTQRIEDDETWNEWPANLPLSSFLYFLSLNSKQCLF